MRALPDLGQRRLLPGQVHDGDRAAVIARQRMIVEGDPVALRGELRIADVPARRIEDLAGRELEPRLMADVAHDGQRGAVRRPVGIEDVFEDLARSGARQRGPRERPRAEARVESLSAVQSQGHLARLRDGKDVRARRADGGRVGRVGPLQVDLKRSASPGGAVHDRLPVGSEAGAAHQTVLVGELVEGWRRPGCHSPPGDEARGQGRERDENRGREADPARGTRARAGSGRRRGRAGRSRDRGERLQVERHVPRGLEALRRSLLEAVRDDAIDRGRDPPVGSGQVRRLLREDRDHRVGGGGLGEGALAREHLVENGPEGEDVRAGIHRLAPHLLRRHVAERPEDDARLGPAPATVGISVTAAPLSGRVSLASPKSRIFIRPSEVRKRFSGFRSRWTIPFSCAAARPRAIWAPYSTAFLGGAARRPAGCEASLPRGAPRRRRATPRASRCRTPR